MKKFKRVVSGMWTVMLVLVILGGSAVLLNSFSRDALNRELEALLNERLAEQLEQNRDNFKGAPGQHGLTPRVGTNGNWWIGAVDTGYAASGQDGASGLTPYVGPNKNWWVGGVDQGIPAQVQGAVGKSAFEVAVANGFTGTVEQWLQSLQAVNGADGLTPRIYNGTWWIGYQDTGFTVGGQNGTNGIDGTTPHIGTNGNWWIGTTDTNVRAEGRDGATGAPGKSAFDVAVANGFVGSVQDWLASLHAQGGATMWLTTAPTADNTSGVVINVLLDSMPDQFFNGFLYHVRTLHVETPPIPTTASTALTNGRALFAIAPTWPVGESRYFILWDGVRFRQITAPVAASPRLVNLGNGQVLVPVSSDTLVTDWLLFNGTYFQQVSSPIPIEVTVLAGLGDGTALFAGQSALMSITSIWVFWDGSSFQEVTPPVGIRGSGRINLENGQAFFSTLTSSANTANWVLWSGTGFEQITLPMSGNGRHIGNGRVLFGQGLNWVIWDGTFQSINPPPVSLNWRNMTSYVANAPGNGQIFFRTSPYNYVVFDGMSFRQITAPIELFSIFSISIYFGRGEVLFGGVDNRWLWDGYTFSEFAPPFAASAFVPLDNGRTLVRYGDSWVVFDGTNWTPRIQLFMTGLPVGVAA